jgi:hypothetical protein
VTSIAEHQSAIIQHLLDEVTSLRERVTLLESELGRITENYVPEIIEIRGISREQAKAEITEIFGETEVPLYYSDIMEQLGIELELVVEICQELIDEGIIGLDTNDTG